MKPFNLEAAKAGAPVVTRNGGTARILAFDFDHPDYSLAVAVTDEKIGQEFLSEYTERGGYYAGDEGESGYDLFMAPVQRTVWVNLYAGGLAGPFTSDTTYESEYLAKRGVCGSWAYIGTFPITYEE